MAKKKRMMSSSDKQKARVHKDARIKANKKRKAERHAKRMEKQANKTMKVPRGTARRLRREEERNKV